MAEPSKAPAPHEGAHPWGCSVPHSQCTLWPFFFLHTASVPADCSGWEVAANQGWTDFRWFNTDWEVNVYKLQPAFLYSDQVLFNEEGKPFWSSWGIQGGTSLLPAGKVSLESIPPVSLEWATTPRTTFCAQVNWVVISLYFHKVIKVSRMAGEFSFSSSCSQI